MTDVYGFNEAKSKIAVVDKATQDAKDSSQDSNIANKALSNVGLTLNEKNLMFSVEQADGTSKNASVELPVGGGEIETEYIYSNALDEANFSGKTITIASTVAVSTSRSYSGSWGQISVSNTGGANALYYDKTNNVLKRSITLSMGSISTSGAMSTSRTSSSNVSGTALTVLTNAFSWLIGLKLSDSDCVVFFKIGSSILEINVEVNDKNDTTITAISSMSVWSTSTSTTFNAGTHTVYWMRHDEGYGAVPILPDSGSMPSTYTNIADL